MGEGPGHSLDPPCGGRRRYCPAVTPVPRCCAACSLYCIPQRQSMPFPAWSAGVGNISACTASMVAWSQFVQSPKPATSYRRRRDSISETRSGVASSRHVKCHLLFSPRRSPRSLLKLCDPTTIRDAVAPVTVSTRRRPRSDPALKTMILSPIFTSANDSFTVSAPLSAPGGALSGLRCRPGWPAR